MIFLYLFEAKLKEIPKFNENTLIFTPMHTVLYIVSLLFPHVSIYSFKFFFFFFVFFSLRISYFLYLLCVYRFSFVVVFLFSIRRCGRYRCWCIFANGFLLTEMKFPLRCSLYTHHENKKKKKTENEKRERK